MRLAKSILTMLLLSAASAEAEQADDLSGLSVDSLMNIEITSVARRGEKLSDTAAAVFVITQEDIERSGAISLPEVLRMAPGLNVARMNDNSWAVGSRGFRGRSANKLLVLIDGRSVYSQVFGGVDWNTVNLPLEDIERIEVIRGPGGAIWGANAVNGVINIITKHSVETTGTYASVSAGTAEHWRAGARHGAAIGANAYYRIFVKAGGHGSTVDTIAEKASGAARSGRADLRIDWSGGAGSSILLAADTYEGNVKNRLHLLSPDDPLEETQENKLHNQGTNVLLRWTATQSKTSETTLQVSYAHARRIDTILADRTRTADVDFQHQISLRKRHSIVWGAGYRSGRLELTSGTSVVPIQFAVHLFSAFAQDQIELGNTRVTIGSKFQYDHTTGLQLQPTLRALWAPTEHQRVWIAATDTVRTPNLLETGLNLGQPATDDPTAARTPFDIAGGPEQARTYEIGYRAQPRSDIAFDLTAFHTRYTRITNTTPGKPTANALKGTGRGLEAFVTFDANSNWQLAGNYTFTDSINLRNDANEVVELPAADAPRHQANLRSALTAGRWELDNAIYCVSGIPSQALPSHTRFDTRVAWHPSRAWSLSISGQNLLDSRHREYQTEPLEITTAVSRSIYGSVTWHF